MEHAFSKWICITGVSEVIILGLWILPSTFIFTKLKNGLCFIAIFNQLSANFSEITLTVIYSQFLTQYSSNCQLKQFSTPGLMHYSHNFQLQFSTNQCNFLLLVTLNFHQTINCNFTKFLIVMEICFSSSSFSHNMHNCQVSSNFLESPEKNEDFL